MDDDELDATLSPIGEHWWFHVDLDVLSTDALAAVDYPQPGGITWERLEQVTRVILARPGCRGASVVIYNPELDDGAAAPRIAEFCRMIAGSAESRAPRHPLGSSAGRVAPPKATRIETTSMVLRCPPPRP